MCVEYAQILSTVTHILIPNNNYNIYKKTHINHPCIIWAAESTKHFNMLCYLLYFTSKEFEFRYEKIHQSSLILKHIPKYLPFSNTSWLRDPPLAMPDEYKTTDVITSYRKYYKHGKTSNLHNWKNRDIPNWWNNI
jgi:hypothetical protein